jgi:hypothetical protein
VLQCVLQCVLHKLPCCSMMQCDAVWCRVLPCVAVCCSVFQCAAVCCSLLQCVAVCCSVLQCIAVYCSVLQCVDDSHTVPCPSYLQIAHRANVEKQRASIPTFVSLRSQNFALWVPKIDIENSHSLACSSAHELWRNYSGVCGCVCGCVCGWVGACVQV